jgi:hypothetical protein
MLNRRTELRLFIRIKEKGMVLSLELALFGIIYIPPVATSYARLTIVYWERLQVNENEKGRCCKKDKSTKPQMRDQTREEHY